MGITELFILAIGLSMDAFAVAICKGLSLRKITLKNSMWIGLWFGAFQAIMPSIGYILGAQFKDSVVAIDHWIAFVLLGLIGANMIKEALSKDDDCVNCGFSPKEMFPLAVATSIDALAIGVTFAFLPDTNITAAVIFIGVVTFIISSFGVKVGNIFGAKYKSKSEFAGGVILILLGIKILVEHLMG